MTGGAKTAATAMTYVAMSISGCLLLGFGFASLHFWALARAHFESVGGIPSIDLPSAAQGAFLGILDWSAVITIVSGLCLAWIYGIVALCCATMTILGSRRAWLRCRDMLSVQQ